MRIAVYFVNSDEAYRLLQMMQIDPNKYDNLNTFRRKTQNTIRTTLHTYIWYCWYGEPSEKSPHGHHIRAKFRRPTLAPTLNQFPHSLLTRSQFTLEWWEFSCAVKLFPHLPFLPSSIFHVDLPIYPPHFLPSTTSLIGSTTCCPSPSPHYYHPSSPDVAHTLPLESPRALPFHHGSWYHILSLPHHHVTVNHTTCFLILPYHFQFPCDLHRHLPSSHCFPTLTLSTLPNQSPFQQHPLPWHHERHRLDDLTGLVYALDHRSNVMMTSFCVALV